MFFADIPGIVGATCIVLAFWLLTHKVVHSHSKWYLGLNLAGGILLAFDGYVHASIATFALNAIWVAIAIYGLGFAHKRKDKK